MTKLGTKHPKGNCARCKKPFALNRTGKPRAHNGMDDEFRCSGMEEYAEPLTETDTKSPAISANIRHTIAEEIRSMVPPPWSGSESSRTKATEWYEVADFTERTGDWEGYQL